MEPPTDEILLQRIALGDEEAFSLLYDRYGKPAYSLARRIVGDGGEAEDVIQDAFLNIWRMARSFHTAKGNARSWVLAVVHHKAIDVCRRRRGKPTMSQLEDFQQPLIEAPEVWQEVADILDRQAIGKAMDQLPEGQRQAIELAYFGGYSHGEIAKLTQLPLGTVKSRLRTGMEKLRKLLNYSTEGT